MAVPVTKENFTFAHFMVACSLIILLLHSTDAVNILGVVTSLSKSHSVLANSIFNEYANSGHAVTVLSPYDVSPKINHYKLDGLKKLKTKLASNLNGALDGNSAIHQQYEEGIVLTKAIVNHQSFKRLISSSLHINVIIFDYDFNDALLGIAQYFKCPVLILTTYPEKLSLKRLIGYSHPVTTLLFSQPATEGNFLHYMKSIILNIYEKCIVEFYYRRQQDLILQELTNDSSASLKEISKKRIAKVFTTSLMPSYLTTAHLADISGAHIPEKSIFDYLVSDSLDRFIHSADEGCIYVSLGSDTDPATLPKEIILQMFQAFNGRPEKIIWSWSGNTTMFGGSTKFYINNWLPQDDILRHRNVKAFVTNGGVMSLQEAIYHEIPIIGIPLTHDQDKNINQMIKKGFGVKLELNKISATSLGRALKTIIENESYKQKLGHESEEMRNHMVSPMKRIKYWINYFHQHRHEKLENYHRFSTIDYYLADIYLYLIVTLVITFTITVILCSKLWKSSSQTFKERKLKLY